jgi:hypothetical protein
MQQVNVRGAKTQLAKLLGRVKVGEEILPPGRPGALKGKIWIADDFDEFDQDLEAMFYGGDE